MERKKYRRENVLALANVVANVLALANVVANVLTLQLANDVAH